MWWPAVVKSEWELPLRLDYGRLPHAYVNQRLQIQLELLMMSGMPLETCWAFNEQWNNKFYYKVASCWLFLLSHTTSMNIKLITILNKIFFQSLYYLQILSQIWKVFRKQIINLNTRYDDKLVLQSSTQAARVNYGWDERYVTRIIPNWDWVLTVLLGDWKVKQLLLLLLCLS